jgi:hypothetical protein
MNCKCNKALCRHYLIFRACWFLPVVYLSLRAQNLGGEIRVASVPDLRTAIANASPGDNIVVANGTYESLSAGRRTGSEC